MSDSEIDETGRQFSHVARTVLSTIMRLFEQHQRRRQQLAQSQEREAQEELRRLDQQMALERQHAERTFTKLEQPGAITRLSDDDLLDHWAIAARFADESDRARGVRDALEQQARHQLGTDLREIREQAAEDRAEDGQHDGHEQQHADRDGEHGNAELRESPFEPSQQREGKTTEAAEQQFDSSMARAERFARWESIGDAQAAAARKQADKGQSQSVSEMVADKAGQGRGGFHAERAGRRGKSKAATRGKSERTR
ncbi:hypothetical protein [Tomitella gaofuii]|uniref:hypothetical protein n=1 Tax=Tomitella gaofuii TaxID=2760083 RepID=UPI0015FDB09A|nr:hypothetical protein [Tomitella gaofuii]